MSNQKILCVTCGKSTRNLDRFCGFTDPPLSDPGRSDVLSALQRLQNDGRRLPKIWYVSDRRRAQETFEIMTAGMHAPVVRISDRLREMNFGDFENLTWEELPTDFQRHYENSLKEPMGLSFPGGESFTGLLERVTAHALEVLSYDDRDDLAIVGHQGSIRIWQMIADDIEPSKFFEQAPESGSGTWLQINSQQVAAWRRAYLNPPA